MGILQVGSGPSDTAPLVSVQQAIKAIDETLHYTSSELDNLANKLSPVLAADFFNPATTPPATSPDHNNCSQTTRDLLALADRVAAMGRAITTLSYYVNL